MVVEHANGKNRQLLYTFENECCIAVKDDLIVLFGIDWKIYVREIRDGYKLSRLSTSENSVIRNMP